MDQRELPEPERARTAFNLVALHLAGYTFDQIELFHPGDMTAERVHELLGSRELSERKRKKSQHRLRSIDVERLIAGGENEKIEFKASAWENYDANAASKALQSALVKEVAGFLNSENGGMLVLGVDDKGAVVGLKKDYAKLSSPNRRAYRQFLDTLFAASLGREVIINWLSVSFYRLNDEEICVIRIAKSINPVTLEDGQGSMILYQRNGEIERRLNTKETARQGKLA